MYTDPQGQDSAIQRAENPNENYKGTHVVGILGPWKHVVIEYAPCYPTEAIESVLCREGDSRGIPQGPKRTVFVRKLQKDFRGSYGRGCGKVFFLNGLSFNTRFHFLLFQA